jgi:hydrogenase/urease accessory protein HupE
MLGLMGVLLPGVEYGIALAAILLGAAMMFEVRPPHARLGRSDTLAETPGTA